MYKSFTIRKLKYAFQYLKTKNFKRAKMSKKHVLIRSSREIRIFVDVEVSPPPLFFFPPLALQPEHTSPFSIMQGDPDILGALDKLRKMVLS